MANIGKVRARQILDSRGNPTVEAVITLDNGVKGMASVPSGASTGSREAIEKRDNGNIYRGLSVLEAVNGINETINNALKGTAIDSQEEIDSLLLQLDNTSNKSNLGANAILAVSVAALKARAQFKSLPLFKTLQNSDNFSMPVPMMNVINGGAHANNKLDIQEFMLIPLGADSFKEAVRYGAEVFYCLRNKLSKDGYSTAVGDEGGFAPNLLSTRHALDYLVEAIIDAGFSPNKDIALALDVAATELYQDDKYNLTGEGKQLNQNDFVDYLNQLITDYPIISIEDGMAENDWQGWNLLTKKLGSRCQIVGDDVFVTNVEYLRRGITEQVANSILIKPNQIGTVTETLQTIKLAKANNYNCVISHRSGETEDTFIADLAVGTNAMQIKTGSLCRTDRVAKYNQLLRIEDEFFDIVSYPGKDVISFK